MDSDSPIPFITEKKAAPVVVETPPAPAPFPAAATVEPTPTTKGAWGGIIGIFLIVVLIITAAFYSWGERLATQTPIESMTAE